MKSGRNIVLVLILAGLAAWLYFYEIRGGEHRRRQDIESARLFPGLTIEDVTSVSITRIPSLPDQTAPANIRDLQYTLRVIRKPDGWHLTEPVSAEGNPVAIRRMVEDIVSVQKRRIISRDPDDFEAFGLVTPAFFVTVETGTERHRLRIGNENPTGNAMYARLDDLSDIFLLDSSLRTHLLKKALDYRNRQLIQDAGADLTGMTVKVSPSKQPVILTHSEDAWFMESPESAPADSVRIRNIIKSLSTHQIKDFIDEPEDPLRYGLANPGITVGLQWGDRSRELAIGADADPGGKLQYARFDAEGPVFTISHKITDLFSDDPFYYRSKTICSLENALVHRIEIQRADTRLVMDRDESLEWKITRPPGIPADTDAVSEYLSDVTYMRATGIKPAHEAFGESPGRIRFYDGADQLIAELIVGGQPHDAVGRWLQSTDQETVFKISDDDAERLLPAVFRFRDKSLLEFDRYQVEAIEITRGDRRIQIVSDGDTFSATDRPDIEIRTLETIYWTLHALKMDRLIREFTETPSAETLSEYGLAEPAAVIRIVLDNNEIQTIRLGTVPENPSEVYVLKGEPGRIASVDLQRLTPIFDLE